MSTENETTQELRTINGENDVDSLESNNDEMLQETGSCGSGDQDEEGSGSGSDSETGSIVTHDITSGSVYQRPIGFPVTIELKITWGTGDFNVQNDPSISVSYEESGSNGEYELALDKSTKKAIWEANYKIRITGKLVYYLHPSHGTETEDNEDSTHLIIEPTEVPFDFSYFIPSQYRNR